MSDVAIRVENLSKRYRIGVREERHDTLAGLLTDWARRPAANLRQLRRLSDFTRESEDATDVLWALRDVSFEVKQGEVVGVIGRNGAGKSTLLKILSRITRPTSGRITLNGRVSSLLEVGTGFHPELTGRENIYLNGTILGMRKAEIDRKFDEIVDFAGVEKFIDTPVKRYSSGMKVRLAFAVAAHLEPEILLVDEVLAVGDVEFQQKSLGKMNQLAVSGRTVMLVSHQMGSIAHLTQKTIMLDQGQISEYGETSDTIASYMRNMSRQQGPIDADEIEEWSLSDQDAKIARIFTQRLSKEVTSNFSHSEFIGVVVDYGMNVSLPDLILGITILDSQKRKIFTSQTRYPSRVTEATRCRSVMIIPGYTLTPGTYSIQAALHIPKIQLLDSAELFETFSIYDAGSEFAIYEGSDYGVVFVDCEWESMTLTEPSLSRAL